MPLFQTSVLKKYLSQQDPTAVEKAYRKYSKYFLNAEIQENIRSSKEEQFQATFLTELFVNVLDYTINPSPKYNLTTEYKNEKNNRKADGAILKDDTTLAVVELKGTNTKDLESIRRQAFDYKVNHKGCRYVITSNFEKLRFYIDDATEHEPFDLFQLTQERFALLYLCLHKDNLLNALPLKIKQDSLVEEEQITEEFYKDYSLFKRELFRDLVKRNVKKIRAARQQELEEITTDLAYQQELQSLDKNVKLALFKKSQKLIDRFLFVFFSEDRGLLTPNSTLQILEKWKADMDFGDERPLYNLFKQYFNYLDTGRKGTSSRAEIYAYNGGLFKPDTILDGLEIDDNLLYRHTLKLAKYDFESQVDVNILGHIFENSLNEIESVNAEIEGAEFDKQKSKRKKDGVFYTPKYITKYIVENTVGKLCDEKKIELDFKEEEYFKGRKNRKGFFIQKLVSILDEYRNWLLQLTICDPACGSGAFLNQALDFLIKEHQYIDELKAKVLGGGFQFPDIENTILENNIYGVDLNEESVEIAKLSLWLRTAQPRRKLNDLSSNIKCGNSLINSKAVAGDKAFDWENAFPKVFINGGFDVVIGNPPYVRQELFKDVKPYLEKHYDVYQGTADLYTYFFELSVEKLVKNKGLYSIIVANKWMQANYAKPLRDWLRTKRIIEIIDFGDLNVFKNVAAYPCIITIAPESPTKKFRVTLPKNLDFPDLNLLVDQTHFNVIHNNLSESSWSLVDESISKLTNKLKVVGKKLLDFTDSKIFYGIKTGLNEAFVIDKQQKNQIISNNSKAIELIKPFLAGRDIKRYAVDFKDTYLILIPSGWTNENRIDVNPWEYLRANFPGISNHLETFKEKAEKRSDQGDYWWELRSCAYYDEFNKPKLLLPDISKQGNFVLDRSDNYYLVNTAYIIGNADLYLLGILNSKLITFFYKSISPEVRGGYLRFIYQYLSLIPIALPDDKSKNDFEIIVDRLQHAHNSHKELIDKFIRHFISSYKIIKTSKNLENWQDLDFGEFIKELNKAIKTTNRDRQKENQPTVDTLTRADEFEWLDLFEQNKKKAQDLQAEIDSLEQQIDAMVYELYGLTEEEIRIVEHK
ncbi:TaqI-like C-terminal specificity domain-containing protein [Pricia sp. S334]|uniref:site-specific DNA-methyltransferase (adenine-specific) n=1 Tax=Pricia mediterranea TaxID=3076079 RepID=A0ABU3L3K7_9FLAO|nr:TaqI-like C-terminal specificity domain-containing protein [Pricia sp. S334]MDT7828336.1 TaqI-like C-terminal specificity domain-containing protein [Pricia sp. S334]